MKYLHTAVRVTDLDAALDFYIGKLGLVELRRFNGTKRPCTIVFLAAPGDEKAQFEVVWYWDEQERVARGTFSHVAYEVDDIYATCAELMDKGVVIAHPPRDGFMAFVKSDDGVSFELFQKGGPRPPQEPWASMSDQADW